MNVTEKDVKDLGINYIETDIKSNVVATKGKFPPKRKIIFSKITNKIIHWAELELDYMGG
jgi:hypothetical protein